MEVLPEDSANIAQLKDLLIDVLDYEDEFSDTDHFMEDLGLSSLMGLEVMVAIEKEYKVKFKEEEMTQLTTVLNVYQALKGKDAKFN